MNKRIKRKADTASHFEAKVSQPHPRQENTMTYKSFYFTPFLALLLALSAPACSKSGEESGEDNKKEESVRPVETAPVLAFDLVHRVEVIGELQGKEEVRVFAQVPERIRSLLVKEGEEVRAGQRLAVLRGDMQADGVKQAIAGLEAVGASVSALETQVTRAEALVKAGTLPRSQLDALQAQLRSSQAQQRQLAAGVSQANTQADRTIIRAPISGVVAGLTLREGDMIAPSMPLLTIVDTSALRLQLRVPERDFLRIGAEMPVSLSPLALPERKVEAKVSLVGPVVDRMTRTGLVEINLPPQQAGAAQKDALVPGSAVRVQIEISRRPEVVQVPAAAVVLTPRTELSGEAIAYVVGEGSLAHKRLIKVGERQGSMLEVKEGLALQERLVITGAHLLKDGQKVSVQSSASSTKDAAKEGEGEKAADKGAAPASAKAGKAS